MRTIFTFLNHLWGSFGNLQSKDISHDRRLTVGLPSGLDTKWKQNPFMRFAVILTLIFSIGMGNAWGADLKTSDLDFGTPAVTADFEGLSTTTNSNNTGSAKTSTSLSGFTPFTNMYLGKNTNGVQSIAIIDGSANGDDPMDNKYFKLTSTANSASVSFSRTFQSKGAFSFRITKASKLNIGLYAIAASGEAVSHANAAVYLQFTGSAVNISAGRTSGSPQKWYSVSNSLPSTDVLDITVVYNNTNSATQYGDEIDLAAKNAHVFINGTAVMDGTLPKGFYINGNTISHFRISYAAAASACVDDIKIYNTLPSAAETCTPLGTINGSVSLSQLATPDPTKLKASWAMNATTGIASYTLEVYNSSNTLVKTINNYTSDSEITGLTPCTEYYVKLYTVSSGGEYCDGGLIGTSSSCTTNGYTYTINPLNVSLKAGETEAANSCNDFMAEYVADTGYDLPTTISVTGASAYDWEDGVLTIDKANVTGNVTVTINGVAQSNFINGETVFIQADSKDYSAWKDDVCVKAWFNASGAGGAAQTTYWLFDATDTDAGKKLFAAIVPSTGDLNQVTLQRFQSDCLAEHWHNNNGTLTKASSGGVNTFRSYGSADNNLAWNGSSTTLNLYGSQNSWASSLATFADQGNGVWTATVSNYTPDATSKTYKIKTSYNNGWIGNTGDNEDATLSDMIVGSTYNVTATLDIKDHSLVMSKTFVKGTVHFNLQGHGSAISDIENVTAGSKISAPSTPTDASYIFGGWYKEAGCVNAWDFANDVVNESMTLYAKWYQVTLVVKDEAGTTLSGDGKPTLTRSGASLTAAEAGNYAFKTIAITSGTGTLSAVSSSTTIATISSDITVTATFWNARTVTKGTGTGTGTFTVSPTGEVKYGSSVTVTCAATDGYKNPWTLTVTPSDGATYDETGSTGSITISNLTKNITVDLAYTDKGCTTHNGTNVVSGSTTSNKNGPVSTYYKYSTKQILYTKTDLGLAAGKKGTIKSIYFNAATDITARKITIYMANSSLDALSTSNYVAYSNFTQVFTSNSWSCSTGWNEIDLDTDFEYNGVGSLVVLIDDNTGVFNTSETFNCHTATTTTGAQIYTGSDSDNADPSTTTWSTYTATNNRPNTKFCIQESDMVQYTVTWHVGENTSTSTVYSGTPFSDLDPENDALAHGDDALSACGSTKFIGWVKAAGAYTDDGKTATWYDTHKYSPSDQINDDVDIYAMYAEGDVTDNVYAMHNGTSLNSNWEANTRGQKATKLTANTWQMYGYSNVSNPDGTLTTTGTYTNISSIVVEAATGDNTTTLKLYYSADKSSWTEASSYSISKSKDSFSDYELDVSDVPSTAVYIRLDNGTSSLYVKTVTISTGLYSNYRTGCTVSCGAPVLSAVTGISANGATISWTDDGKAGTLDHYEYAVWADGEDEPTSGFVNNGTTKNKALTGLLSNTDYNYKVRRVCTGDDNSRWSSGSFTTGNISLTFSVPTGASAVAGQNSNVALPTAEVPTDCGDCWAFAGWTTAEYAESSSAPAKLFAAGDIVHLAAADGNTMYAVYKNDLFELVEATTGLVDNNYYVLTAIHSGDEYAMSNTLSSTAATSVDVTDKAIERGSVYYIANPSEDLIWKFTGSASSGRLYNEMAAKYLDLSGDAILKDATTDNLVFTMQDPEKDSSFDIASESTSSNYLYMYSTHNWDIDDSHTLGEDVSAYMYQRIECTYATSPNCPKYTVTWDINNGASTSTTDVTKCEGYLSALPSAPADNTLSSCQTNGKFMGWSANKVMPAQDIAPADIFSEVEDAPEITENVTFYAVFANGVAGAATPVNTTYTFTSKSWGDATNSWSSDDAGDGLTDGRGIQIASDGAFSGAANGSAAATTKNNYTSVTKVIVTYSTNKTAGAGTIAIKVNNVAYTGNASVTSTGGTSDRTIEYTPTTAQTGKVNISVSCTTNSIFIKSVQIYYTGAGTVYEQYRTACCNDPGFSFTDENDAPVTEYVIVREDLASASDAVEIDCNYTSANTEGAITWYSTRRAALGFPATGAYTWTTPSSQPAGLNIDIANKKISASATGVWTITINQAEGGTTYCPVDAVVTVRVKTVDKFVDAVNGNFGGDAQRREDTGDGITLPTEAEFSIDDGCSTERRLLGWVKESDLSSYTSGYIDSWKTDDPATNKVIAPGTKVSATGITWYAVWGTEK